MKKILIFLFSTCVTTLFAIESKDRTEIEAVIQGYTDAWNHHACVGFGEGFTKDADFVNIYGMHFSGRSEIEERHIKILQTFLKDSKLKVLDIKLREVQPNVIVALVKWELDGYRSPRFGMKKPATTREGIFTQIFIQEEGQWLITASQNTLIPDWKK